MSMFVHKGGGGVKKIQKTVHMVCRWPPSEHKYFQFPYQKKYAIMINQFMQKQKFKWNSKLQFHLEKTFIFLQFDIGHSFSPYIFFNFRELPQWQLLPLQLNGLPIHLLPVHFRWAELVLFADFESVLEGCARFNKLFRKNTN